MSPALTTLTIKYNTRTHSQCKSTYSPPACSPAAIAATQKSAPFLKGLAGTCSYTAPEIERDGAYTKAVLCVCEVQVCVCEVKVCMCDVYAVYV